MRRYEELVVNLSSLDDDLVVHASSAFADSASTFVPSSFLDEIRDFAQRFANRAVGADEFNVGCQRIASALLPTRRYGNGTDESSISAREVLFRSLEALPSDVGLRLRVSLDSHLAAIPWEFALVPNLPGTTVALARPLVLQAHVSMVRHARLGSQRPPLSLDPNNMRVVFASATEIAGYSALERGEADRIGSELQQTGITSVVLGDPATTETIRLGLASGADVFHFIGHSTSESQSKNALVLAKSGSSDAHSLGADELSNLLTAAGVQVVILSACNTGTAQPTRFAGLATDLIDAGIPAVVAMQFTIDDSKASQFASAFFKSLQNGEFLDRCVHAGRTAMLDGVLHEWGIPVLYTRSTQSLEIKPGADDAENIDSQDARSSDVNGQLLPHEDESVVRMVIVPAGSMDMNLQSVEFLRPFLMAATPVTQEKYERIVGKSPSKHVGSANPVDSVSWFDAVRFCNLLSKSEALTPAYKINGRAVAIVPDATGFRLPFETEWEYACRLATPNLDEAQTQAWLRTNGADRTRAVSDDASDFSLQDMLGNVYEWCFDWWGREFPTDSGSPPQGPARGNDRVVRGGSFRTSPRDATPTDRTFAHPASEQDDHGFRLVRSLTNVKRESE